MSDFTDLSKGWQEKAGKQKGAITKLTSTNWESYWQYLVKPHSQITTLNCSLHATQGMVPHLADAIFTRQLKSHFRPPLQIQPMIDICDLKDNLAVIKSPS